MTDETTSTTGSVPVNVEVLTQGPGDVTTWLYRLEKRLAALEATVKAHLVATRQARFQEIGLLERELGVEQTTAQMRAEARENQKTDLTL